MLVEDKELKDIAFFSIDQAMRRLRNYSTRAFAAAGYPITVDQWLVLKQISDRDGVTSQTEIAAILDKDAASMTRMLDILVKNELIFRKMSEVDRRRFDLIMTKKGIEMVRNMMPLVKEIRATALEGISEAELLVLKSVLGKITANVE